MLSSHLNLKAPEATGSTSSIEIFLKFNFPDKGKLKMDDQPKVLYHVHCIAKGAVENVGKQIQTLCKHPIVIHQSFFGMTTGY